MKTIKSILVYTMTLLFIQFCNIPKADDPKSDNTFTFDGIKRDTINKTDGMSYKQGEWRVTDWSSSAPTLIESGHYLDNKKQGVWYYYDSTGKINRIVEYKDDLPVKK